MRKFLLDTHIIVWFLSGDKRLNDNVEHSIRYFQDDYYVSIEALHEVVTLQRLGNKIDLNFNIEQIAGMLEHTMSKFCR